jgi:hypothetical protein
VPFLKVQKVSFSNQLFVTEFCHFPQIRLVKKDVLRRAIILNRKNFGENAD